jgi:FtsH-binding integral membrane protein
MIGLYHTMWVYIYTYADCFRISELLSSVCQIVCEPDMMNHLSTQISFTQLATTIVGGLLSRSPNAVFWVQAKYANRALEYTRHSQCASIWSLFVAMIGSMVNLFLLYWKRHSHPANLIFLSTFTLLEAATLGFIVAFYETKTVLQALVITLGIFFGLTLFTLQSKVNRSSSFSLSS